MAESSRPSDRAAIDHVLNELTRLHRPTSMRIGISGAPGVGKSSLIEVLGSEIIDAGHRVAVLAIDPTSGRSGGSILGDKTRMTTLAANPEAFIRPSPAGSSLGGVARSTGAAVNLCEAVGFDVVLVETVGVGQSEVAVGGITDLFVLLVAPATGDDLQGIKRGVMELADIVAVTKKDGDLAPMADQTASAYAGALSLLRPKYQGMSVPTIAVSALTGRGIAELWKAICATHSNLAAGGHVEALRKSQAAAAFWSELADKAEADHHIALQHNTELASLVAAVEAGEQHPRSAASQFWQLNQ